MRRKLILAVLILLAFVLQGTVFQTLSIASIVPNLLLILTVSFGFMRGKKEGMFVGFFCGLLIDIFYGSMIGFYALIYMYYLLPFLVIGNKTGSKTLTLELYFAKLTSGQYGNPWELIFPAVFVTIIPIIILYIFLQKYIVAGVSEGAVKM